MHKTTKCKSWVFLETFTLSTELTPTTRIYKTLYFLSIHKVLINQFSTVTGQSVGLYGFEYTALYWIN